MTLPILPRVLACALGWLLFLGTPLFAEGQPEGAAVSDQAKQAVARLRQVAGCPVAQTDDIGRELVFRGREATEIKGRGRGGDDADGAVQDLAVYVREAGRIVSYVCFVNASSRKSGEAIVSLVEASNRADTLTRGILPGATLELEGVKRHRQGESESLYYEARYASVTGEITFFEPPVRLLLNASTGGLFRLDIDPDWLAPPVPPRVRISRAAAERIATLVLRGFDLAPAFGPGAVFKAVSAAEMFVVHPNDALGLYGEAGEPRARVAWVVPFRIDGGSAAGLHSLFVDAATGRSLGGLLVDPAGRSGR